MEFNKLGRVSDEILKRKKEWDESPNPEDIHRKSQDFLEKQDAPGLLRMSREETTQPERMLEEEPSEWTRELRRTKIGLDGFPKSCRHLHPKTEADHMEALRWLQQGPTWTDEGRMVIEVITEKADERGWAPTTQGTQLGKMIGAMRRAPLYGTSKLKTMDVRHNPYVKEALTALSKKIALFQMKVPEAVTLDQVKQLMKSERMAGKTKQLLMLCWLTSARPPCVLKLERENILAIREEDGGCYLDIKFVKHKTAATRGPYEVSVWVPPEWRHLVDFPNTGPLFAAEEKGLKRLQDLLLLALQTFGLDTRALRRGTLQHMSRLPGVDDKTLMQFSGHTNIKTLLRYLNYRNPKSFKIRMEETSKLISME